MWHSLSSSRIIVISNTFLAISPILPKLLTIRHVVQCMLSYNSNNVLCLILSAVNEVAENDSSILTTPLSKTDSITSRFRQFCKVSACVRPHEIHIIV